MRRSTRQTYGGMLEAHDPVSCFACSCLCSSSLCPSAHRPVCPGNLHRVFLCELQNGLPHPVAVITQRDVARILLIFLGLTLQGEVGRQHRPAYHSSAHRIDTSAQRDRLLGSACSF